MTKQRYLVSKLFSANYANRCKCSDLKIQLELKYMNVKAGQQTLFTTVKNNDKTESTLLHGGS